MKHSTMFFFNVCYHFVENGLLLLSSLKNFSGADQISSGRKVHRELSELISKRVRVEQLSSEKQSALGMIDAHVDAALSHHIGHEPLQLAEIKEKGLRIMIQRLEGKKGTK